MTRDTTLGLMSAGINYYDSQGIMVSKSLGVKSAKELGGAAVCVQPGTTTELNLADWFRANKLEFKPVVINSPDEAMRSYVAGRCDAYTTDKRSEEHTSELQSIIRISNTAFRLNNNTNHQK